MQTFQIDENKFDIKHKTSDDKIRKKENTLETCEGMHLILSFVVEYFSYLSPSRPFYSAHRK